MAGNPGFIPLPSTGGGPSTQTFEGLAAGMNVALPPQELDDTSARYLQDILLDKPGIIRRRGPLSTANGFPNTAAKGTGITATLDPLGNPRVAVANGDAANGRVSFLNSAFSAINASFTYPVNFTTAPPNTPYHFFDSKAALNDGVWIGTSAQYSANAPSQTLALWRGGISATYTTGTITVARGSASVVGVGTAWLANVTPGMFLFANTDDPYTNTYVGVVQSIQSDTTLTLTSVSPYPVTAKAYTIQALRGFFPRINVGNVTTTTASAVVTGSNTKFISQGVVGTNCNLYRASDMAWIGRVTSITNNTSLTLVANAAIAMNNEAFVILNAVGDWTVSNTSNAQKAGWMNATYAEAQWYANSGRAPNLTSRVWFSDTNDPENVDMSAVDGNFINVASSANYNSPITGMAAAYNALLVFKENETFGIFGNSPSSFNVQKIEDDGTLSTGSVEEYGGGVIWAGRTGIFFYDGVQTTNIVAGTLGNWYKELVRVIDPTKYRVWSTMSRDHYFLFLEQANPTVPVVKGNVSTSSSHLCIVINMLSHAPTIFTNFSIRGGVQMPLSTGLETLFLVNTSANVGGIFSSTHVFEDNGNDSIISDTDSAVGPDFYIESKKYNAGDSLILKLWSQLIVNYECSGDALNVDTVVGLNSIGATSTTQLTPTVYTWDQLKGNYNTWNFLKFSFSTWNSILTAVFKPKRVRFLKRSQNFGFRIWQNSSTVNNVQIGPFQLGYKQMRPGRV